MATIPSQRSVHDDVTSSQYDVSMEDYIHLHGMRCRPSAAKRALRSFNGGILFLPHDYDRSTKSLGSGDFTGTTVFMYYLLVFFSLTGLSTLLNQTVFLVAQEEEESVTKKNESEKVNGVMYVAQHNKELQLHECTLEYIKEKTNSKSLLLKRRFEYHFRLVNLSVVMLHFYSPDNGLLHLVEVFQFENSILGPLVRNLLQAWNWGRMKIKILRSNQSSQYNIKEP
jgi:hypothetical protein